MGGTYSAARAAEVERELAPAEIQALLKATHYTAEELMHLRTQFLTDIPEGAVSWTQFLNAAHAFGIRHQNLAVMLFRAFDMNDDKLITFFEFARGMSIMTRGSNSEKIAFAFDMLDVNRCGELHIDDVRDALEGLESSFGAFVPYDAAAGSPSRFSSAPASLDSTQVALRMFERGPTMSREQFRDYVAVNPGVMRGLAMHT